MKFTTFLYVCGLASAADITVTYNTLTVTTESCKTDVCTANAPGASISAAKVLECFQSLAKGCVMTANIDNTLFTDIADSAECGEVQKQCIYDPKAWTDVFDAVDSTFTITFKDNAASVADDAYPTVGDVTCEFVKSKTECDPESDDKVELTTDYTDKRGKEVPAELLTKAGAGDLILVQYDGKACADKRLIRHTAVFGITATGKSTGGGDGAFPAFAVTSGALVGLLAFAL